MSSDREPALDVFFSYAHHDEELRDALETHLTLLKREGAIRTWHDRRIGAGREWQGEIDRHLESADLVLLLVSPDFIASDYCYDREMTRALERHEAGEARVIPILLRPVDWHTARFAKLQALPANGKPVTTWSDRDSAFAGVARDLRAAITELRQAGDLPPAPRTAPDRTGPAGPTWRGPAIAALMAATAIAAYFALGPGGRSGPSAVDLRQIFTAEKTSTEVVGRLALHLVEDGLSGGRQVSVGHAFSTGDYFRFEVTSSRDGWLYVFHRPPGGRLDLLWPARGETGANAVHAYERVMVPPGEEAFLFTDEIGEEYFYVALAAAPSTPAPPAPDPTKLEGRVESFIARDLHGSLVPGRRRRVVVARPGEGFHVYFTTTESTDAAVELRLRHDEPRPQR